MISNHSFFFSFLFFSFFFLFVIVQLIEIKFRYPFNYVPDSQLTEIKFNENGHVLVIHSQKEMAQVFSLLI